MSQIMSFLWKVIAFRLSLGHHWITTTASSLPLSPLQQYGTAIHLPFPNNQTILGVSGLSYDTNTNIWIAASENNRGAPIERQLPLTSTPRLYRFYLDFENGTIDFNTTYGNSAVIIQPSQPLKIEDLVLIPNSTTANVTAGEFWLVSEPNSRIIIPSTFLSHDFASTPDLNTYDPETFHDSQMIHVDGATGQIIEDAILPSYALWSDRNQRSWDEMKCTGDRPFQGLQGITIIPNYQEQDYDHIMVVAFQSSLYQDGPTPKEFYGSATRLLFYGLKQDSSSSRSTTFLRSYRYDTSQLTIQSVQKGARHFNALTSILAINATTFLISECEDFAGFGRSGRQIRNRIYYLDLSYQNESSSDSANLDQYRVDHCKSILLDCNVTAPPKRLIWERHDDKPLDGIAWGPHQSQTNGVESSSIPTIALTFEDDTSFGVHFELYSFDASTVLDSPFWSFPSNYKKDKLLQRRIASVIATVTIVGVLIVLQLFLMRILKKQFQAQNIIPQATKGSVESNSGTISSLSMSQKSSLISPSISSFFTTRGYAYSTTIANSFLLGGITFGYPALVLILRKQGTYGGNCACGSFCSQEKADLALVSTVGFAITIGCRLFIGLLLDAHGPKITSVFSCVICLAGTLLVASTPTEKLANTFFPAWILLSFGSPGLHLSGFHMTNLYKGEEKKSASSSLSAAFGASSAIFPIMQALNQYAGVELREMTAAYSVIVFLLMVNNFLVQPWCKVEPGIPLKIDLKCWKAAWWERNNKRRPLFSASLVEQLSKFELWGETLFHSLGLWLVTYYLSISPQLMFEKGDIPFTYQTNNWSDYIYTRLVGVFNCLGFLWFPVVEFMVTRLRWPTCFFVMFALNMIAVAILIQKNLEIQIVGFALLSLTRLMLFSFHFTYILDIFGMQNFGTLNGVSAFVAALIGLLSYPLQIFAIHTSYAISIIPIACGIFVSVLFPIFLRRRPVSNWAESYAVDPFKFRYPKTEKELIDLVVTSTEIRVAGAMHSCAPLLASDGIIISMDNFNKILEIDVQRKVARIQGGVKIHHLCEALAPLGLAMGTLGTVDWQSLSGAAMTGTHGGALTIKSIHSFVSSYSILKADGSMEKVDRKSNPKLFSALAPSMGTLGIVTELEVDCVPLEYLEAKMISMTFSEVIPMFEDFMKMNKYCRIVIYPSIQQATVWMANPVAQKGDAVTRGAIMANGYVNFRDETEKVWLESWLWYTKRNNHKKADELLSRVVTSQLKRLRHYEGQYNHVLCKERNNGIPHADIEFAFDWNMNQAVLHAIKGYADEKRMPYYNFEIRSTQGDDALLSCCHGRDTMWIDFQAKSDVSAVFFADIEKIFSPFGFRKHWAKGLDNTNPEYVAKQFPGMREFVSTMIEMDPNGKFRNKQGRQWFNDMSHILGLTKDGSSSEVKLERLESNRE